MKFTELEQIMSQRGINSLADIARALKTTPQAVSNWKARNQIPYRIVTIINQISDKEEDRKEYFYQTIEEGLNDIKCI